jgi:hypothetical protein
MGYRNKTYVIFDGDEDIWAYGFMKGWNKNEHIDFNFYDAHDVNEIRNGTQEETVKRKLNERIGDTKQGIVLIGEKTKNLFRYVRWEMETFLDLGIPLVAVNLNGMRQMDATLCPPILQGTPTIHVAFKAKVIKHALDEFCEKFPNYKTGKDWYYKRRIQDQLGWYRMKAKWNRRRGQAWFGALIAINGFALISAIARIAMPEFERWPTDILVAGAAAVLAWVQTKKFHELSATYTLTAHEILLMNETLPATDKEADFSIFVGDAENAFSREHTQWQARRDKE